ncbi:HD domain-containing protein [Pediococcus claussenii]|uniref:HD/PDEase domain-containing protein n=1 Tax=Pediococcus claussenii (strain ATCC BAA-344 / DSM 14800 / JCM 18046 / KCTC 3811 / LMG 21948 / P06) TaxID=701521 RepID=G8PE76_PEDCP|nr:HD domain-containing protein [Pediococcus claussenii]AEV95561.1 hypothetical protein PECL_1335 [Pediococcus claussenii ATCC BAA-344]ANZ69084.1 phosphohydrolase [Pediococcus claussenii]ANZ70900.1 phosphohydrolase [Pediococcus claussenii]KRN20205.1 hypothetical protein IV79_GL000872 [Pediococcus claussenii]
MILSSEQTKLIDQHVKDRLGNDFTGHDYAHILRVVKMAKKLAKSQAGIDLGVVTAAAYLHDVIDEKLVKSTEDAEKQLSLFMQRIGVSQADIDQIFDIITHMSYAKNLEERYELSAEGNIVQDADRLDAIGAIGIGRVFYYGGSHEHVIYDPKIAPRKHMTHDQYRENETVINHFYEKLLKLADLMNTEEAKRIAQRRTVVMQEFLEEFDLEWNQER